MQNELFYSKIMQTFEFFEIEDGGGRHSENSKIRVI